MRPRWHPVLCPISEITLFMWASLPAVCIVPCARILGLIPMSPAEFIVPLTIFLSFCFFLFLFFERKQEEKEGLVKAFDGERTLATENAFQNAHSPSRHCFPLLWTSCSSW